eukprot:PITA_16893
MKEENMIFIQEKKCLVEKIREIHSKWLTKYEYLEVKADKTVGGILILWNPRKIRILDVEASRNYLSVVIQPLGDKEFYLITNFYGPQKPEDKIRLLTSLEDLRDRHSGIPWILGGDFNMIRSLSEKKGGTGSLGRDSIAFLNFINNMRLVDTKTSNGIFTWNKKRGGESQVASKLDIFIISEDLILTGLDLLAMILPFGGSDHWPIQLEASFIGTPRNRPFRFENIWLTHPDFTSNIEKWWTKDMQVQGTKMFLLHKRLKHIKIRLKYWNKNEFGNQLDAHKEIEAELVKHFQGVAKEPLLDRSKFISHFTKHIPKLVTQEDNYNLNRPGNEEEVNEFIKEMQNGKALGLDGFNVDFFKAFWGIIK